MTVGLVLLSIPGVRDIGVTLVASAGLAGLAAALEDVALWLAAAARGVARGAPP